MRKKTIPALMIAVPATVLSPVLYAQGGVMNSTKNKAQIAVLHWYTANQITQFSVGANPRPVASDGADVWVANFNSNTVSQLRATGGLTLGTHNVGTGPWGLASDGANIWGANSGTTTVSKLWAIDGVTLGTYDVGTTRSRLPSMEPMSGLQTSLEDQ